jgi:hypothetical protein
MEANQSNTNINEKKKKTHIANRKTNNVMDLINAWLGNGVMNT